MQHPKFDKNKQVIAQRERKQEPIIPIDFLIPPMEIAETDRRLREIRKNTPIRKHRFWQK